MATVATGMITLVDLNDSRQLQLYIKSNQKRFQTYDPNTGVYDPNWPAAKPVLTPELYVAGTATDIIAQATSIRWFVDNVELTASNADYTLAASGVKTLTINTNVLASVNSKLFTAEVTWYDSKTQSSVIAKADIEFTKVSAGERGTDSVSAVLTNETATIAVNPDGSGGVWTPAVTTLIVYEGTTVKTADYNFSATVGPAAGNVTGSLSGNTYTATAANVDSSFVDITATHKTVPTRTVTKRFNISKNKQGTAGTTPTTYWLVVDASALERNVAKVYNPLSIAITAKSQTGTGAPGNYSGRFIIEEQASNATWSTKYTSAANEATRTYTPSANNIMAIRVKMYLAGGTTTLLDEQLIPVVDDGAEPVRAMVWCPDGNVVRNGDGNLTVTCDVYEGTAIKTATYQWYMQNPAVTVSEGAGVGWDKLDATTNFGTTGYTSKTLTVPASAIASVESFKCVATYNGVTYADVATVTDISDPYQVTIVGVNTFKNGTGTVTLTAQVSRGGELIDDTAETKFNYAWSVYDANNQKNTSFGTSGTKTGRVITVAAGDINVRGNVVCDVTEK